MSFVSVGSAARAELTASECVVIYNQKNADSEHVAHYYARRRGLRVDHLLGVSLPVADEITRAAYEQDAAAVVRAFLHEHPWGDRIRCLVTCYGIPLRVGPRKSSDKERVRADALDRRLIETVSAIESLIDEIDRTGVDEPPAEPSVRHRDSEDPRGRPVTREQRDALYRRYLKAQTNLAHRHDSLTGGALEDARRSTFSFVYRAEGEEGLIARADPQAADAPVRAAVAIRQMRQRLEQQRAEIRRLSSVHASPEEFDSAVEKMQQASGLFGVAGLLQRRAASLRSEQTTSALDSELSLLDREEYELSGWQLNPLCDACADDEFGEDTGRVLMVARLDAPTPEIVERMIDDSIAAEATGLRGTFYIDARGITRKPGLGEYDRDLFELGDAVRHRSTVPVVMDVQKSVFQEGQCPHAALYCGWYSLEKYVDAFDFVPGAVAVHIASFELISLRDDTKRRWCRELQLDGAAATIGAVAEPYLQAFPKPTAFFERLMTGRDTLVECYYATLPYLSWRLALLGDPLYNPFKAAPAIKSDDSHDEVPNKRSDEPK